MIRKHSTGNSTGNKGSMRTRKTLLLSFALLLTGIGATGLQAQSGDQATTDTALATFAGGCFWCMEPPYDKLEGVLSTTSGFMGGHLDDPSYDEVTAGDTGHYEVVQVEYDPRRVSYETLLETFWPNVDPFDAGGQFCDRGDQYLSAIFFHNEEQQELALESKRSVERELAEGQKQAREEGAEIVTDILAASEFYPAEDYHQDYYQEHSIQYNFYRWRCGRDDRLEEVWGES